MKIPVKLRTSKVSFLCYISGDLHGTENIGNEILIPNKKYLQLFNFACVKLKKKSNLRILNLSSLISLNFALIKICKEGGLKFNIFWE